MSTDTQASTKTSPITTQDWLILAMLGIVWGSSYILIKKGLLAFTPVEMAILRIEVTGMAFVPIYFFLAKGGVPRNKLPWVACVGFFGSGFPAFMFAFAQTSVASSIAGMLNSLVPIFTWALGLLFFRAVFVSSQLLGVAIGFIGAMVIIALEPNFSLSVDPLALLIVVSSISYALSGNIVKSKLQAIEPITLSSIAFLFIGIPALLYSFSTDIYSKVASDPQSWFSLGAIILLALIGTVLANILFYRLIQRTNAVFASSVSYLIPVTALIWGFIDGEVINWPQFAGLALILTGVWVLRR